MNKTNTKRLSIALCIILLLFVSLGICFAGNFGTTPVAAAEQTTVANMTAYSSFAENQRLYAMTEDHIDVNMGSNLTIDSIKSLQDFDGNQYTLFELDPIGYHVFTKKHAVMAVFTIVLLCFVIIPVSLFFAPSYSPSHDVPSYKLNQLYTREDVSSVTFDSASVSNGLFVDGKRYDGYYLILSGLFDFSSFSFSPQNDVAMFYTQEEQASLLMFNEELSKALSSTTLFIRDTKGITNGRLCFVFEISAEQYNLTTEGTRLTEKGDIRLTLTDCTQKTDNATFPVNFIFFFDEISLQA